MRRRSIPLIPILVLAVGAAACTDAPPPKAVPGRAFQVGDSATSAQQPANDQPRDLVIVGSGAGFASLDPATGSVLFRGTGTPRLGDWSEVFTAAPAGPSATTLQARQPVTGETLSTLALDGRLEIRAVSADGERVALMAPPKHPAHPWNPEARAFTDLVVADPAGYRDPIRFHLRGNFEPEAFSTDGWALYLIRFVPPTAPSAYRVARLDLMEGKVYDVFGREKSPAETMTGTRLSQLPSPDGSILYTLYSTQPPEYAAGHDSAQAAATRPVAFVHTLNLSEGWAACIGLPRAFWGGNPAHQAMAAPRYGPTLYVADLDRGVVSALDTDTLGVTRTKRVDLGPPGSAPARMTVSADGETLFVTTASGVVSLSTATFDVTGTWTSADPVSGLGVSSDGSLLYVALPTGVEQIDLATGTAMRMFPLPSVQDIDYVGPLGG